MPIVTACTTSRLYIAVLAFLIAALSQALVNGEIVVEGISDRQVTNGPVRIRIIQTDTTPTEHRLDGQRIPDGVWLDVTAPGYHELRSVQQPIGQAAKQILLVRFVIQSARGQAEWALPPWTPLPPVASGQNLKTKVGNTTRLEIFMPDRFPTGLPVPVVATVTDAQNRHVNFTGALEGGTGITLKRGFGSGMLPVDKTKTILFDAGPLSAEKTITIDNNEWHTVEDDIKKTTTWDPYTRIHVTSNLTVAKNAALIIQNGCVVKLAPKIELTVHGRLVVDGTKAAPVVFCPESPDTPWGGITLREASAEVDANWLFVTGSGGNPWWFVANSIPGTHRNEQAAFFWVNNLLALFLTASLSIMSDRHSTERMLNSLSTAVWCNAARPSASLTAVLWPSATARCSISRTMTTPSRMVITMHFISPLANTRSSTR